MELTNNDRDELFGVIRLQPSEVHKSNLVRMMVARVAPVASEALGQDEVMRLCGTRAIIALLIARELESRASGGELKGIDTSNWRSGDLLRWLQRRLQENSLLRTSNVPSLTPPRPDASIVAAACSSRLCPRHK